VQALYSPPTLIENHYTINTLNVYRNVYFLVKHNIYVHKRPKIPNKLVKHLTTGKLPNMNLFELQLCFLYKQHDDELKTSIFLFLYT